MTSRSALAAVVLSVTSPAFAGIEIAVDDAAPFTVSDLEEAVRVRWRPSAGQQVVVRVGSLGDDQLLVVVGDRTQTIELVDRDRLVAARVVALVVTSMVEEPPGASPAVVEARTPSAGGAAGRSPASLLVGAAYEVHSRDGGADVDGYTVQTVRAGIATTIRPNLRVIGSLGYGYQTMTGASKEYYPRSREVPLRLGIEASTGSIGVELGAQIMFYEAHCQNSWRREGSAYGAVKVFVPLGARTRLVGEVGGHRVVAEGPESNQGYCYDFTEDTDFGGWVAGTLEWAL